MVYVPGLTLVNEKPPPATVVAAWTTWFELLVRSTVQPERPDSPPSSRPSPLVSPKTSPLIVTGTNSPKFTVSAWPLLSVIVTLAADEATYPDCETTWTV